MVKKLATAQELEKLIQNRISTSTELDGDCAGCKTNSVSWHEPDETGSNWDLDSFRGPQECGGIIYAIVADLKRHYNLKQ